MKGKKLFAGLTCAALLAAPGAAMAESTDVQLIVTLAAVKQKVRFTSTTQVAP